MGFKMVMNEIIGRVPLVGSNYRIAPGPVGSVGDVLPTVRLAQSTPSMPMRVEPWTLDNFMLGQNISDGDWRGGGTARAYDSNWDADKPYVLKKQGYVFKNIEFDNLMEEPVMGSLEPSTVERQKRLAESRYTGLQFKGTPGGYGIGAGLPRGSNTVRVTDMHQADPTISQAQQDQRYAGIVSRGVREALVPRSSVQRSVVVGK